MARTSYFLLVMSTLAAASVAFWSQTGAFPIDHPSFYGCALLPLIAGVVALIAAFSLFDQPRSAPAWSAPLIGLALGVSAGGAVLFTASFVFLGPPLLLYAFALWRTGMAVSRAAPEPSPTEDPSSEEASDDELQPSWIDLDPETRSYAPVEAHPSVRGHPWLIGLSGVVGLLATASWRPPVGAARPLAPDSEIAAVVSMPTRSLRSRRILRDDRWVEVNGNLLQVRARLDRPQLTATLDDFQVAVEPCLYLEEATVDGFFAVPGLNTYRLEPGGPAISNYAEGRHPGGDSYAWLRLSYKQGRASLAPLARLIQPLARVDAKGISATLEVDVDLDRGWILLDATTRLRRPISLHRASFCWIKLSGLSDPHLSLGLAGSTRLRPPQGPNPKQAEFLVHDGDVGRALRARYGSQGPYEVLQQGEMEGWLVVIDGPRRLLIVAPDWAAQASLADSRGAGHGLRENALVYTRQGDELKLVFDLAGTRLGVGRLSVELPAGLYRNRLFLRPLLPHEDARVIALATVERLGPLR